MQVTYQLIGENGPFKHLLDKIFELNLEIVIPDKLFAFLYEGEDCEFELQKTEEIDNKKFLFGFLTIGDYCGRVCFEDLTDANNV